MRYFNADKLKSSDSDSLTSLKISNMNQFVQEHAWFTCMRQVFLIYAGIVEHFSSKLEGCLCHAHIWVQKVSLDKKKSLMRAETGRETCIYKGRQGPWWCAVGRHEFLDRIRHAPSHTLDPFLQGLSSNDRILSAFNTLRIKLIGFFFRKI